MVGLKGKTVCISLNARGSIAGALKKALEREGAKIIEDSGNPEAADVAICSIGKMIIRHPADVGQDEVDDLYRSNYALPRAFTEKHLKAMKASKKKGLILHLGSVAARYGNVGAEDYAAFKLAFNKYLELRARTAREDGIRIVSLNLGGVDTAFWKKVASTADPRYVHQIIPSGEKALSVDDVAEAVLAILKMPEKAVFKDALLVSLDYQ